MRIVQCIAYELIKIIKVTYIFHICTLSKLSDKKCNVYAVLVLVNLIKIKDFKYWR